jgi:serine/threonine protein kinase
MTHTLRSESITLGTGPEWTRGIGFGEGDSMPDRWISDGVARHYRIKRSLGPAGLVHVCETRDDESGSTAPARPVEVVVKEVRQPQLGDAKQWCRRQGALRLVRSPGLAPVHDVFVTGAPRCPGADEVDYVPHGYVVMDRIEGPTLEEWLNAVPDRPVGDRRAALRAVAAALDALHGSGGLAHGDVGSATVVLGSAVGPVLVDVGGAGTVAGDRAAFRALVAHVLPEAGPLPDGPEHPLTLGLGDRPGAPAPETPVRRASVPSPLALVLVAVLFMTLLIAVAVGPA